MSSQPAELLVGSQHPRLWSAPAYSTSAGEDAVDVAQMAGLELDPWQQFVLQHALGEREDGKWSAPTVGLVCPRQNGKNAILEARELAGLFIFGEEVIIHSAHEQATSSEQFRRLLSLIEGVPQFRRRMRRPIRGKGSEAIELTSGQRILFKTRTGGGARGFSIDCIVFDEAYELPETAISALVPAKSARPNTQTWYTSSAVDQEKHHHGLTLSRTRSRGIEGRAGLAYFEWSAEGNDPARVPDDVAGDPRTWAQANPGFGVRILAETVRHERDVDMGPREFAVERLGIGDWPDPDGTERIIPIARWRALADADSEIIERRCFAFDVAPDRSAAAIAAAGYRDDGHPFVGVIEHHRGTSWVPGRVAELVGQFNAPAPVCDATGPVASLVPEVEKLLGSDAKRTNAREYAQACGMFYDAVMDTGILRHAGDPDLAAAVDGAATAPLGDAWKWARKSSAVDITPLVACTLALWGSETTEKKYTKVYFPPTSVTDAPEPGPQWPRIISQDEYTTVRVRK